MANSIFRATYPYVRPLQHVKVSLENNLFLLLLSVYLKLSSSEGYLLFKAL